MSDLLQLGHHPDADQLNAFVEQASPAHEREQTLAHLAQCADCRAIVALSLPSLEATPMVEPDPTAKPWFSGWSSGWRLAWFAAPAFAALVVLGIYLRNTQVDRRQAAQPSQVAEVHPPSSPIDPHASEPLAGKVLLPSHLPSAGGEANQRSPSAARAEPSAKALPLNGRELARDKALPTLAPSAGLAISSNRSVGVGVGVGVSAGTGYGAGMAPARNPAGVARPVPSAAPAMPPTSPYLSQAASSASASANAPQPAFQTAPSSPLAANAMFLPAAPDGQQHGLAAHSAVPGNRLISTLAPLPSGQPILSFASNLHKMVALDTRNALFCSQDDGRHWKPVSPQWQGHAVALASIAPAAALVPRASSAVLGVPERFHAGVVASAQLTAPPEGSGGSLSGIVTDPTGAVIPGATIIVQESRYALARTARSDGTGHYTFRDLARAATA